MLRASPTSLLNAFQNTHATISNRLKRQGVTPGVQELVFGTVVLCAGMRSLLLPLTFERVCTAPQKLSKIFC